MAEEASFTDKAEVTATPEKEARRWLLEIQLATKREKEWREKGAKIIDIYRGTKARRNSFNILWANTETARPALYNSPPQPDVRRRFRQDDMLGKAVGEVMERGLSYCTDAYDLDLCMKSAVLDALLPGRAVDRVRYVASIKDGGKGATENHEELDYQQAFCEHVQWDDFRMGPGKTWGEVMWIAFGHDLRKDDLIERFGEEVGNAITLNSTDEKTLETNQANSDLGEVFKRARVWEIWDKEGKRVFYVNESYKAGLIFPKDDPEGEPPLKLRNFYPIPRPLQLVEDTGTTIPRAIYTLYEQQAAELNLCSTRINKLINAARVRGMYDSTLTELAELMKADDNDLLPVQQARAWMANGGLEKAIWWMPVEQIAKVLKELYIARESAKQVIYELTGLSDIQRGDTNPNETLGAQKLKADFGSQRMQRQQREVQRYSRDLMRLLAEVIGEHFDEKTLGQMTGLNFPTAEQKQLIQMRMQAAQAQGQQVPPEAMAAMQVPSWAEVMAVLKSDMQREYRVDVETNSTVADTLAGDMEGLKEVLTGLVNFWEGVGPAVASGALSIDAVKSISLVIARRAKMGLEVEDAIETGMQPPKPQATAQAEPDHSLEIAQLQAQAQGEATQAKAQTDIQTTQEKTQSDLAIEQIRVQGENERERIRAELKKYEIDQDNATKITVAEIAADAALMTAQTSAEASVETAGMAADSAAQTSDGAAPAPKRGGGTKSIDRFVEALMARVTPMLDQQAQGIAQYGQMMDQHGQSLAHVIDYLNAPKTAERDASGRLRRLVPQMSTEGPLSRPRDITADASGRPVTIQ